MLGMILAIITGLGPVAGHILEQITSLEKSRISAKTEVEKAAITQEIEALHDKRAVLVAEAGSRLNTYFRAFIAFGPAMYISKIFIWDKVIGSMVGCSGVNSELCRTVFQTDPLDPYLWAVVTAVIGFYFLSSTIGRK